MASQRDLNITRLINEAEHHFSDLVKWPESEGTKKEADLSIKALHKIFRDDSYPDVFRYMAACQIAIGLFNSDVNRDVKFSNFKIAWQKLSELFD